MRTRLDEKLAQAVDYPLTILSAGTGYGKSTALIDLGNMVKPLFWYSISETDRDPTIFFLHLASAFGESGQATLQSVEDEGGKLSPNSLTILLNELTNKLSSDSILVLDDFHLVSGIKEIAGFVRKLVDLCPPKLHTILATRQIPDFPELNRWRVKNKVLFISSKDLSFTSAEIESLFRDQYHYPITSEQAKQLLDETGGWAIALQGIWQSLQSGIVPDVDAAIKHLPSTLDALFDYLAPEVLARQPSYTQKFLLTTSVLRQMDGKVCDALLDSHDGESMLQRLHEAGLFVDAIGEDIFSYQRLFHDFLEAQLKKKPSLYLQLHKKAAYYYRQTGQLEETIYHILEAREYDEALNLIGDLAADMMRTGRQETLGSWIDQVPKEKTKEHFRINLILGDIHRLGANFDDALKCYRDAEKIARQKNDYYGRSQALRSQAQVYLDTIRPLKAEALLEEAIRLLEPQEYRQEVAELLELLAENKLNSGFPDQAKSLLQEAHLLQAETNPNDIYLEARAMLRTGQLTAAQELLEHDEENAGGDSLSRPQRFHRERSMLLSLICIMQGDAKAATKYAQEGIRIGKQLKSDFVEAVGYMRMGHAIQLNSFYPWGQLKIQKAIQSYERSMEIVKPFKVSRVGVEPLWGLSRAYGYSGVVSTAEPYAKRALEISTPAGDEWIGDLVKVNLGAAFAMVHQEQAAIRWLTEACNGFIKVGDTFGQSAVLFWLALNAWWAKKVDIALAHIRNLIPIVREHNYGFLLTQCTQLGLKDDQAATPLLIEAWHQNVESDYLFHLLKKSGVELDKQHHYHPGATLWIRTLGPFYAWHGDTLVNNQDYKRDKARRLLQLLVTNRKKMLQREQIVDSLWPDLSSESGLRDFKVALNALNRALEPDRPAEEQPFFVVRQGETYGLNPLAKIVIDADQFEKLSRSQDLEDITEAVNLYEDDFLPDCRYKEWSSLERERLKAVYLNTAEHLAEKHITSRNWDAAIQVAGGILSRDEYHEGAYRKLMSAYAGQGNRAKVQEIYELCATKCRHDLEVDISPETKKLYQALSK